MANLNTKRKRRALAESFREQHVKGWKITPLQRKRRSPWKGAVGPRRPAIPAEFR